MIRHFFLDKTNSIIEDSAQNTGLNPVLHVGYGKKVMKGLIHFDECEILKLVEDKTFADLDSLKFTLKMTNYFSIDGLPYEKFLTHSFGSLAERAASFDLILFKLPCDFDEGRGFDFVSDFWIRNNRSFSTDGSNWFFAKNGIPWRIDLESFNLEDEDLDWSKVGVDSNVLSGGIYSTIELEEELQKFENGEDSIIVATQHFDFGDENLCMDITNYVKEVIETGVNNGLCLSFAPRFDETRLGVEQYVGFVDDNTNTFFHPYVEADYSEHIMDNRDSFTVGRKNSLYLYTFDDGNAVNLDKLPSCSIEGVNVEVKQVTKGVYKAEFDASSISLEPGAIYYDTWSEIELNGQKEDNIELEFSTNPKSRKLQMGSNSESRLSVVPSLYGINDDEKIHRGEIREVTVDFRKEYDTDKKYLVDTAEYRLYTKDGNREIDVIGYNPIEKAFLNNFFMIYAEDLIPGRYFVDVRTSLGREVRYYKEALRFDVVSDVTERYQ